MKVFLFLFLLLCSPFAIKGQPKFIPEYRSLYEQQTQVALIAKKQGDWLTLIQIAKQSYIQKQNVLWQNGLIEWAKEIILYQHLPSAAWYLSGYYIFIEDHNNAYYWKLIGDEWKNKSR